MPRGRKRNRRFIPQPWIHNSSSEGEQHDELHLAPVEIVVAVDNAVPAPNAGEDDDMMGNGAVNDDDREVMEQSRYDQLIGNKLKKLVTLLFFIYFSFVQITIYILQIYIFICISSFTYS